MIAFRVISEGCLRTAMQRLHTARQQREVSVPLALISCIGNSFTNTSDDCVLEVECRFPLQPDLPSVRQSENS
jgi:hypothetical protein